MVFLGLHTFVSFLQAYIFMLLTMVYLAGAVAEEH
jgi:F-type H+-transporting ATPase subunit a